MTSSVLRPSIWVRKKQNFWGKDWKKSQEKKQGGSARKDMQEMMCVQIRQKIKKNYPVENRQLQEGK